MKSKRRHGPQGAESKSRKNKKKLLSLTLALLMSVMLLGVGGAKKYACAEEDPYVGQCEITCYQQGDP